MPIELSEPPKLRERILAADLVVVGIVAGLVEVTKLQGFETPRLAALFEVKVDRVLLGEAPAGGLLVRVFGDGSEDDPTWTSALTQDARRLLILSRDIGPELPEHLFAPYFSSAFEVDEADRVLFPPDVLDSESQRVTRAADGRTSLSRVQALVDALAGERAVRERELEKLIPRRRSGRYPEIEEMPAAVVPAEAPLGPPGRPGEPETIGGRAVELEQSKRARRARRASKPRGRPRD